jgi:hypothetical protein
MAQDRIIVIGCREFHDRERLKQITDWTLSNGRSKLFKLLSVDKLDHYDMTTRPHKGDALVAIREHKNTICVIALHLFGLDHDCSTYKNDLYCYTKENHKLLDLCLQRNIPLICWGDQPFRGSEKLPHYVKRTHMGGTTCHMYERSETYE